MRLECIDNVREMEVLGKSILSDDGQILLKSGVVLTDRYLKKLKTLGVYYIYVEDERLEDVKVEDTELTELKQCAIKSLSRVAKNVSLNGEREVKDSIEKVKSLVEYILDNKDVDKSLNDIKTYDNYTYVHCLDTSIMATFLAASLNINKDKIKELATGAVLHDVGKTKISNKIINKTGKLTEEEFKEIRKHPIYGRDILEKKFYMSDIILKTVSEHHERVDGKGYPYGLEGNNISKYGRIVAICDVYDAVSSDRCYRRRFSPSEAYELILAGSGNAFDEDMIMKFRNTFSVYPLGAKIRLSNGIEGYVSGQNKGYPDRPIIRVFDDYNKSSYKEIDLLKCTNVTVKGLS